MDEMKIACEMIITFIFSIVYDPKLWRVRVKKGFERIAAMALMNKQIDFTKNMTTPKPFAIYSATHIDSIENSCEELGEEFL